MGTRRHYVTFYSPGTFFDESTTKPVAKWDPRAAMKLASGITERHGARPYGFKFETQLEAGPVSDGEGGVLKVQPKTVATSGMHYIKGKVLTLAEVEARGESHRILASNMRGNNWPHVCETTNGYRHVGIFGKDDCVVDADGTITRP